MSDWLELPSGSWLNMDLVTDINVDQNNEYLIVHQVGNVVSFAPQGSSVERGTLQCRGEDKDIILAYLHKRRRAVWPNS
jgi:hypothetical protein